MSLIRVAQGNDFIVDYDKDRGMYRVSVFEDNHYQDECWFDAYEEKEVLKTGIVGTYESTPITVDSLQRILNEYFDISNDTYAYNLTRVKSAFEIGTMTFDDFEEFTEDTTRDLAEYIIKNLNK